MAVGTLVAMAALLLATATAATGTATVASGPDDQVLLRAVAAALSYNASSSPPAIGALNALKAGGEMLQEQLANMSHVVIKDDIDSTWRRIEAAAAAAVAESRGVRSSKYPRDYRRTSATGPRPPPPPPTPGLPIVVYLAPRVLLFRQQGFCALAQSRARHARRLGERRTRYILIGGFAENGGVLSHPSTRYEKKGCLEVREKHRHVCRVYAVLICTPYREYNPPARTILITLYHSWTCIFTGYRAAARRPKVGVVPHCVGLPSNGRATAARELS